jgi:hypothetical protein
MAIGGDTDTSAGLLPFALRVKVRKEPADSEDCHRDNHENNRDPDSRWGCCKQHIRALSLPADGVNYRTGLPVTRRCSEGVAIRQ